MPPTSERKKNQKNSGVPALSLIYVECNNAEDRTRISPLRPTHLKSPDGQTDATDKSGITTEIPAAGASPGLAAQPQHTGISTAKAGAIPMAGDLDDEKGVHQTQPLQRGGSNYWGGFIITVIIMIYWIFLIFKFLLCHTDQEILQPIKLLWVLLGKEEEGRYPRPPPPPKSREGGVGGTPPPSGYLPPESPGSSWKNALAPPARMPWVLLQKCTGSSCKNAWVHL